MTQQSNTTNWVIQGSNGQPQMIKLVQSGGKAINMLTPAMSGTPLKIYKSPSSSAESSQVFNTTSPGGTPQIIRTLASTTPKIVSKTVHVNTIPKGTKTIRLTPSQMSQMQSIKFVNTSQKIHIQQGSPPVPVASPTPQLKNVSPPILARKRADPTEPDYKPELKRVRKSDKIGKGLRHFSMKVCEKVKQKGTTTYNEVADELVSEFTNSQSSNLLADQYDQKNIRRRVYDALNVLMAMNIISKEKKEIRWIGLPTNSLQECHQLEKEVQKKINSIRDKEKFLDELIMNQIAFKNLAKRNQEIEETHGPPCGNSYIQLPFIVVNTNKKTVINCSISNDKMEYMFQFSDKFEISDDLEILKQIGMMAGLDNGGCTPETLEKIKTLIPESLHAYIEKMASGRKTTIDQLLSQSAAGSSSMPAPEEYVEAALDEDNSRQSSSYDAMSPGVPESSEEEVDSDMSSDVELN